MTRLKTRSETYERDKMRAWRKAKTRELGISPSVAKNKVTLTHENRLRKRPWDLMEDVAVLSDYNFDLVELAISLGRTLFAVQHRRKFLWRQLSKFP